MKEKNKIQFYIYPDGLADTMGQDEIVLVRDSLGSLNNNMGGLNCVRNDGPVKHHPIAVCLTQDRRRSKIKE